MKQALENADPPQWLAWVPLVALPPAALLARGWVPDWLFMWVMAGAIYASMKWQTWWVGRGWDVGLLRSAGYLLAWPGMDAPSFFHGSTLSPSGRDWVLTILQTAAGAVLVWVVVRSFLPMPMVAGWIGMVGLVLLLHFGTFRILALMWQRGGVAAMPIMRNPAAAHSLSEFWGQRWNLGFRRLAHDLLFEPMYPRVGTKWASAAVFVASGLIHELVISLPARAGYGLPTLYFLTQALGVHLERSRLGRRLGLGSGIRGRAYALLVATAPVYLLFHPPFVLNVMVPFLRAIGAFP